MSDLLILIYIIISILVGIPCLYKGFVLKKKTQEKNLWKLFLLLGSLFTLIVPGIIIFFYFYMKKEAMTIMCYKPLAKSIGIASTNIAIRKGLFNKFLKDNKINQRIYNKIYRGD